MTQQPTRISRARTVRDFALLSLVGLILASPGQTQDAGKSKISTPPPAPSAGTPATGNTSAATNSEVVQLKREITGNFLYRFLANGDESASLIALPAPAGTDNIIALAVPSTIKAKTATLEIVDPDRSRVARFAPGNATLALNDASFKFVQTVLVPVQVKGKGGLTAGTVTLATADKSYNKSVLLTASDAGTAKFTNVPIDKPVTVTVSAGANAPLSQTQTLTVPTTAEGYRWQNIEANWPDAKSVPLSVVPTTNLPGATGSSATTPAVPGSAPGTPPAGYSPTYPPYPPAPYAPANTESPFSGILSTIVSLAFLGGIGYGLYWAYQQGHVKTLLDKLGIQTQPVSAGGPQLSPFDKAQKTPVQPITDGTAAPLAGGGGFGSGIGAGAPTVANAGPRLVATMGTYAGNIFPLQGTSLDIGRDATNPVPLPQDTNASRRHATIQLTNGQASVMDNGSSNGTFVNGVRIPAQSPHPLQSGDEVQIGMTRFRFEN